MDYTFTAKFYPGQVVKLIPLNVEATIWEVRIGLNNLVTYDCFWWVDNQRTGAVLCESELTSKTESTSMYFNVM